MANEMNTVLELSQLQKMIDAGGPVMIVLLIMSVIALSIVLLKLWQFFRMGLGNYQAINAAIQQWRLEEPDAALVCLKSSRNPAARVVEVAMMLRKQPDIDDALAREEVMRVATIQLAATRVYMKLIELVATLSPLLGLLGTVLGMIKAFQRLEGAGTAVDPAVLSGGIWEALLTTAAGLIIAIPAVMILSWLERRIERFKLAMEDSVTQVFTSQLAYVPEATVEVPESTPFPDQHKVPARKASRSDIDDSPTDVVLVTN